MKATPVRLATRPGSRRSAKGGERKPGRMYLQKFAQANDSVDMLETRAVGHFSCDPNVSI
jgi:hypothetical protein